MSNLLSQINNSGILVVQSIKKPPKTGNGPQKGCRVPRPKKPPALSGAAKS
jgi:hypothetical protein